jgi:UDP-N-acetylmuramate dehydrogenase
MNMENKHFLHGQLQANESLAMLNTWHVGGIAKQTYRPKNLADLSQFLQSLPPDEPIVWLGLGSNVLIPDQGIDATVILTHGGLDDMQYSGDHVRVEAGVPCAKLAKFCAKNGLSGGCFFAGIPGTVGGALAMNAGAFGGETWKVVKSVEMIDRKGQIHHRDGAEFMVSYRHVDFPKDEWFVAAHFQFEKGNVEEEQEKIRALIRERRAKQPIGEPSCGSVFRNPEGHHAAQLIEQCGLKGLQIGGAIVSQKHANFIINTGHASAADIEALMSQVQQRVFAQTGVQLVPEVHILGTSHG